MRLSYFPNNCSLNSGPVLAAFLEGCRQIGLNIVENSLDTDIAVIWSMLWAGRMKPNEQIWQHYRSQNKPVLVLEVGALKRGITWKLGLNGVNGQGYFGEPGQTSDRARHLGIAADPWKHHGKDIIICLQRSASYQWHGMPSVEHWLDDVVYRIRKNSTRPIVIRPHPRERVNKIIPRATVQYPQHLPGTYDNFDFDPNSAWAVVNWNSGPGVQSILSGVPAFVGNDSLAAPVANLDLDMIENPLRPVRTQWINDLCYTEWTTEELATGVPISRLIDHC